MNENEKRTVLALLKDPSVPYETLVRDLGISRRTVSRTFSSLASKGIIERIGTNKTGYWKVISGTPR